MTATNKLSLRSGQSAAVAFALLVQIMCGYLSAGNALAQATEDFQSTVQPFLSRYCYECHSGDKRSGDRSFDSILGQIDNRNALAEMQDILDQLNLGEMPPSEASQPVEDERQAVVRWLTDAIAEYHQSRDSAAGETVLRRLNRREYLNSVRDLLQLNMQMFDPTESFPRDQTSEHLDNVGQSLVTSGYLLSQYLAAAESIVDRALYPLHRPEVQRWTFSDGFRQQPEIDQVHGKINDFAYLTLYEVVGADKHEGAYAAIAKFADGVPESGWYDISFDAEALHRLHPFDDSFLGMDRSELLRLGIVAGNRQAGPLHKPQPMEPLLAELELVDGVQRCSVRVWLDKGFTPRFTFRNGMYGARTLWTQVFKRYPEQFPEPSRSGIVEARLLAIKHGHFPQIHIDNIVIEGPHYDSWPRASQRAALGDTCEQIVSSGEIEPGQIRESLRTVATRAYRREILEDELERLCNFVSERQQAGRSTIEAYADALKLILCLPSFLFLDENTTVENGRLSSHALAARLAMFLWSSLPDDEMNLLAKNGQILSDDVLAMTVQRMLDDERAEAFIDGFLDSWLTLRELGASPPDRNRFADFYHHELGTAMRQETRLFAQYMLRENLPLSNFIDSDFTFVNRPLARHYGIEPPASYGFEKVQLVDRRRGGLLGHASVLTVTANGIDTSPVIRGVWLLENILGTPPSPPPPDVEPLDPDVRGATTIREQLEKHRSSPNCYSCHRKIDPPGFALENFDAIGSWRDRYSKAASVDSSGQLANGQSFRDVVEFKQLLLEQHEQFSRNFTEKLLAYALGRHLQPEDRPQVDQILEAASKAGFGFRDLIVHIATCDAFATK